MKRYAIIIGCDEYRHYSNIRFCTADAFLMQEILTEYCDYEYNDIELIFPTEDKEKLSIESINNDIKKIVDKIESGDTLILYFAGHGMVYEFFEMSTSQQRKQLIHLLVSKITINKEREIDSIEIQINDDVITYLMKDGLPEKQGNPSFFHSLGMDCVNFKLII